MTDGDADLQREVEGSFSNLGVTLKLLRELRGMSLSGTARGARIGKTQLSKYENGKEFPKLETLGRVLESLRVGYLEFFLTLKLIDRRAETLGGEPPDAFLNVEPIALSDEVKEGFKQALVDLFNLQAKAIEVELFFFTTRS